MQVKLIIPTQRETSHRPLSGRESQMAPGTCGSAHPAKQTTQPSGSSPGEWNLGIHDLLKTVTVIQGIHLSLPACDSTSEQTLGTLTAPPPLSGDSHSPSKQSAPEAEEVSQVLTAHKERRNKEMKRGVRSQPDIQCTRSPLSSVPGRGRTEKEKKGCCNERLLYGKSVETSYSLSPQPRLKSRAQPEHSVLNTAANKLLRVSWVVSSTR